MEKKCCICGKTFIEHANSAEPVRKGICCELCNQRFVINSRILNCNARKSSIIPRIEPGTGKRKTFEMTFPIKEKPKMINNCR